MPSQALSNWTNLRVARFDEIEAVHKKITPTGPGRKWSTEQLNKAYVMTLASQFQGFARDLHSEAATVIAQQAPVPIRGVIEQALTQGRQLDRGNASPSSLGSDFALFGMTLWDDLHGLNALNKDRQQVLERVNVWRNAIAHDSPIKPTDRPKVAGTAPTLKWCKRWRRSLVLLAPYLDDAVAARLRLLTGTAPW